MSTKDTHVTTIRHGTKRTIFVVQGDLVDGSWYDYGIYDTELDAKRCLEKSLSSCGWQKYRLVRRTIIDVILSD